MQIQNSAEKLFELCVFLSYKSSLSIFHGKFYKFDDFAYPKLKLFACLLMYYRKRMCEGRVTRLANIKIPINIKSKLSLKMTKKNVRFNSSNNVSSKF